MQIRDYSLPAGWFPHDPQAVKEFLSGTGKYGQLSCRAVIAPHAGWYYSGHLAAGAINTLKQDAETIIVIGGHLAGGSPPLFAMERAVKTPFGSMPIDTKLRSILKKELCGAEDCCRDNTVEVLLPMVHYFFPKAELIWLRLAAEMDSFHAGKVISHITSKLDRNVNVIGSTDLTHYGLNYGFSPQGKGASAMRWVREVNDAGFIKAAEAGDCGDVLRRALQDSAACSAGAVLGVMGFAIEEELGSARLLEYTTSADADGSGRIPDSFVGYAAMAFI